VRAEVKFSVGRLGVCAYCVENKTEKKVRKTVTAMFFVECRQSRKVYHCRGALASPFQAERNRNGATAQFFEKASQKNCLHGTKEMK
jgi:hypothetical protein